MKIKFRFYYYNLPYRAPYYLNLINCVRLSYARARLRPYDLIIDDIWRHIDED